VYTILKCLSVFFILTAGLHADEAAEMDDTQKSAQVPRELSPAFEYLLSYTGESIPKKLDSNHIDKVIEFVNSVKDLQKTFSMGKRKGATSNYYEFSLNKSLKEVLDLVYNPDIPSYIATPASIRRAEWINVNGKKQKLPKLSGYLNGLTEDPVLIKGVEFIENTPDTFSGAYYAYELDRALLLIRHNGSKILISMSRQRDKSEVGKKGLVLGSDDNWDYLYTGEKGCTRSGLGWVNSYMYDSASIAVYYEENGPSPKVHCGMFKWLRAGWAGINMVRPHHIRDGVKRFAKPFKNIVESPNLADTDKLSKTLKKINAMSEKELREKVQRYYLRLKKLHENQNRLAQQWFDQLTGNDGHLAKMNPKEMKAVLEKAYLKHLLGKKPGMKIGFLPPIPMAVNEPYTG
jgi:hypothetical protein